MFFTKIDKFFEVFNRGSYGLYIGVYTYLTKAEVCAWYGSAIFKR